MQTALSSANLTLKEDLKKQLDGGKKEFIGRERETSEDNGVNMLKMCSIHVWMTHIDISILNH